MKLFATLIAVLCFVCFAATAQACSHGRHHAAPEACAAVSVCTPAQVTACSPAACSAAVTSTACASSEEESGGHGFLHAVFHPFKTVQAGVERSQSRRQERHAG